MCSDSVVYKNCQKKTKEKEIRHFSKDFKRKTLKYSLGAFLLEKTEVSFDAEIISILRRMPSFESIELLSHLEFSKGAG